MSIGAGEATLRVALVGAGRIAREAHLPAWVKNEAADIVWVVDSREDVARATAEEWKIPNWTTDYRDVLARGEIDAVDICLPAAAHAEVSLAFLKGNCHVLVEKPVALSLEEAKAMRRTALQAGVTLMVAENWSFSTAMQRVNEILEGGKPWEPIMLQASHESALQLPREELSYSDTGDEHYLGYLFTSGTHTLNLSRELVGEIGTIAAFATPAKLGSYYPLDNDIVLAAQFKNNAVGSFNFTGRSRHLGERRLTFRLIANRGVIEFDVWSGWVRCTQDGSRTTYEANGKSIGYATSALGFIQEIAHFVECIAEGKEPRTSVDDQLRTLAAVLSAYRSLEQGGSAVDPASLLEEG